MIENVSDLQEATRSEVVVRELGIAAPEFFTAAPLVIHVASQ
jgi:hypothetical protein